MTLMQQFLAQRNGTMEYKPQGKSVNEQLRAIQSQHPNSELHVTQTGHNFNGKDFACYYFVDEEGNVRHGRVVSLD